MEFTKVIRKNVEEYSRDAKRPEKYCKMKDIEREYHLRIRYMQKVRIKCLCGSIITFAGFDGHYASMVHYNKLKKIYIEILFKLGKLPVELCNIIVDYVY